MALDGKLLLPLSLLNLLPPARFCWRRVEETDMLRHSAGALDHPDPHLPAAGDRAVSGAKARDAAALTAEDRLARDPNGAERCVACYLCSAACPVECIALQAAEDENGRRYPEFFRINFSRCIFCGFARRPARPAPSSSRRISRWASIVPPEPGLPRRSTCSSVGRENIPITISTGWPARRSAEGQRGGGKRDAPGRCLD